MSYTRPTAQRTWRLLLMLLVAFGLVASVPLVAQSGRGTLSRNGDGLQAERVIPGAAVDLKEISTGSGYATKSNAEGLFTFNELRPESIRLKSPRQDLSPTLKAASVWK